MKTDDIQTGAQFLQRVREEGGQASDGPVKPAFGEGWGVLPFRGDRAHWWKRIPCAQLTVKNNAGQDDVITWRVVSKCGRDGYESQRVPLLGPGNVARCARCDAIMAKYRGRR